MIAQLLGEPSPVSKDGEPKTEEVKEEVSHDQILNPNQHLIICHTRIELYYI